LHNHDLKIEAIIFMIYDLVLDTPSTNAPGMVMGPESVPSAATRTHMVTEFDVPCPQTRDINIWWVQDYLSTVVA
jgi:hypothetical protein